MDALPQGGQNMTPFCQRAHLALPAVRWMRMYTPQQVERCHYAIPSIWKKLFNEPGNAGHAYPIQVYGKIEHGALSFSRCNTDFTLISLRLVYAVQVFERGAWAG
jgi:hypothetical protein